jgi:hemerythrin-like domain-containing protein
MTMTDNVAQWHTEHANFEKLLRALERELDLFDASDTPNYELMLDIMYYMNHFPDVFHHPKEDLAFAKILERHAGAQRIVADLTHEHVLLKDSGEKLLRTLDALVNDSILSRENVAAPCRAYIEGFRRHIEKEEAEIVPLAAKLLHANDWAAIDMAIRQRDDPLFGKTAEKRYETLRRYIATQSD